MVQGGGVGMAPVIGPKVQELVTHIKPLSVRITFGMSFVLYSLTDLAQDDAGSGLETFSPVGSASRVLNIVSTGPDGELLLTFTFEWDHPEIEEGSPEAVKKQKEYQVTAPKGVVGTVNAIRQMVKEGKL
jgi:hypothetical protein